MNQAKLLRTKIVATLGPASNTLDKIVALAEFGVDVFRINFAHGTHEQLAELIGYVRQAGHSCHLPNAIQAELEPPLRADGLQRRQVV